VSRVFWGFFRRRPLKRAEKKIKDRIGKKERLIPVRHFEFKTIVNHQAPPP